MQLSVFEPSNGLSLRDAFNRLLEDSFVRPERFPTMSVDVMETQETIVVKASVPGAAKDSIQVSYEKDVLTIKAEIPAEQAPEQGRMLLRERPHGSFGRTFRLPFPVDPDAAQAEYKDGVLTLTLPKQESHKPRFINVQ